jgi:hypothetical protein
MVLPLKNHFVFTGNNLYPYAVQIQIAGSSGCGSPRPDQLQPLFSGRRFSQMGLQTFLALLSLSSGT